MVTMHSLFLTEKPVPLQSMASTTMCSVIALSALTKELDIQDRQFSHREMTVPMPTDNGAAWSK